MRSWLRQRTLLTVHERQGWTGLDFSDEVEVAELRRLHESLQLEVIAVIESLEQLKASAEYELCSIVEQRPGVLDEVASEQARLLEMPEAGRISGKRDQGVERPGIVHNRIGHPGPPQRFDRD